MSKRSLDGIQFSPGRQEIKVVAARAATAGSEHGAVGGAVGRPRVAVAEKMSATPLTAGCREPH